MLGVKTHNLRVALVTEGSGGIGHAIVKKLTAIGFTVAAHYSGKKGKADTIVEEVIKQTVKQLA
ncbi:MULTISPECIES: hypothetical protein [Bacillaceae]|uniref:hypothetical protein n=1 Tax=Bacillaceae TaxID=186817 RepID=UPI001E3C8251|nr:hypothetical protein [Bacillus sp. Au-Bac7]MCE4050825.1 hypothetical protein [Bacillus sp. Au-Bac7]